MFLGYILIAFAIQAAMAVFYHLGRRTPFPTNPAELFKMVWLPSVIADISSDNDNNSKKDDNSSK